MLRSRLTVLVILLGVIPAAAFPDSTKPLIVHEWGTFTSFQAPDGTAIPGVNVDDEPVPDFVHRLNGIDIVRAGAYPGSWAQGAPRCHPDVTLRLETPVLYFYPRIGFRADQRLDVEAIFLGGWLTEFFPSATPSVPGFPDALTAQTRGSLKWNDLELASAQAPAFPETTAHVWLAPRNVRAASVTTADRSEAEKYVFYRGVAHLDAPIVVRQDGDLLVVSVRDGEQHLKALPPTWLVRVLPGGRVRFATLQPAKGARRTLTLQLPSANEQSATSDLDALHGKLMSSLVAHGLFEDEARAMLETWRLSYFASEGTRVFFLLPQAWTDGHLPLSISSPADVTRVMMGRIEIVSPHQRNALARLYELPAGEIERVGPLYAQAWSPQVEKLMDDFNNSHSGLYEALGREVPEALRLYDSLGRFRDALLAHEWNNEEDPVKRDRLMAIIGRLSTCAPPLRDRGTPQRSAGAGAD